MLHIAHIVNPVAVSKKSDLYVAQPITFETMKRACEFSNLETKVSLLSAQYPEDSHFVPDYLMKTRDLDRSILDIEECKSNRKLPYIKDILDRLYESSDAEYLIYTNVDIGVRKTFYSAVADYIKTGIDSFVITRRTISNVYSSIEELPDIYLDDGKPHIGWCCFVFHRDLYPEFVLGKVCIGVPPFGRVMLCNCIRYARNFKIFTDQNLLFHIGDDGRWKRKIDHAQLFNIQSGIEVLQKLFDSADDNRKIQIIKHLNAINRDYRDMSVWWRRQWKNYQFIIKKMIKQVVKKY